MDLQINKNLKVWLQAVSVFYDGKKVWVQWKDTEADAVAKTVVIADAGTFDAFLAKSETDRQADYIAAIATQY